jgi:FAD:protein FMN transferase
MRAQLCNLITFLLLVATTPCHAVWHSASRAIMGTAIHTELEASSNEAAQRAIDTVMLEMTRIDNAMSVYKADSELSRVNTHAAKAPLTISQELFDLIEVSLNVSAMTHGAFDITFASVGRYYDYRKHQHPTAKQITQALPAINYRHIRLNKAKRSIQFTHPGVYIDLGGIAKGHAVDRCLALLKQQNITHAIVTAGGDSGILGDKNGQPWMVGIQAPRDKSGVAAVIPLEDSAISTSGDYERYFEADGKRYHHILNPRTGTSASGVQSVTIIGPNATLTDGLSTGIFVLGLEKGLALVNQLKDIDAVIVDAQGKLHYSQGLSQPQAHAAR